MYLYVDTAKGKRLNHFAIQQEFIVDNKQDFKTIAKGEKCLVFCNGTIGQGRIAYNYKKDDAVRLLKSLIAQLEGE